MMQPVGMVRQGGQGLIVQQKAGPHAEAPLLARFVGKIVLDILPAALASAIGGFLFSQYQLGHAVTQHLATEQVTPASAEMIAMVRDEHAMMMDYLKTQMAAAKNKLAAEDAESANAQAATKVAADARNPEAGSVEVKTAEIKAAEAKLIADAPQRRSAVIMAASKPPAAKSKAPASVAAVAQAPLVIAQAEQTNQPDAAPPPPDRLARDPDSLLAKTLDLKDHVVAATRQVTSAIGDVFSSVGDRISGVMAGGRQLTPNF